MLKWIKQAKSIFDKHPLYYLYLVVLLLVCFGVVHGSGMSYIPLIALFFTTFTLTYFLGVRVDNFLYINTLKRKLGELLNEKILHNLSVALFIFIIAYIIFHQFFLGHVPALKAYLSIDYYGIALIRQSINEHDVTIVKYICSFIVKALLPFTLLYFFIKKSKLYFILLIFGIFYAIALMQKSLIVTILFPSLVYSVLTKRYLNAVFYVGIFISGVYLLVYITNPSLRASQEEIVETMEKYDEEYFRKMYGEYEDFKNMKGSETIAESFSLASNGIIKRVFFTTGNVATHWFDNIPSKFPYAHGCGYNFMASSLGCDFKDYEYSKILYKEIYKKNASRGLKGTLNAASFVYDYANFGAWGMAYSGVVLALIFVGIRKVFGKNIKWLLCLNFLYVFWLSSSFYTTLMFSGGWFIMIGLYLIFESDLKKALN